MRPISLSGPSVSGPTVPAARGRRLAPALCAALLVPVVGLPLVAGTALADSPEPAPAEVLATAAPAEPAREPQPEQVEQVERPAPAGDAEPADDTVVLIPPVVLDAPADDPGPVPDDVERPDLVVGLSGPASGWAGGESAFALTVANAPTATAPAAGFTVTYVAPAGHTVLSVDTPFDADWACALSSEASCTWLGELAVGQSAPPVTVVVGHGRRATGTLTSTARGTFLDGEVVLADNTATAGTRMQAPELAVAVGAPDSATAGAPVSMVLSVTNTGPGWASGFSVSGAVSDAFAVDDLAGRGFDCDVASLTCTYADELAPGLSAGVTLTGTLAPSHSGEPMTTTALVEPGALSASAVTAVAAVPAASPVEQPAVDPVDPVDLAADPAAPATDPPVPAAPAPVAPASAPAVPTAVRISAPAPTTQVLPRAVAAPRVVPSAPAAQSFAAPDTLAFTGSRSESQLASGVALLVVGLVLTLAARRRSA